MSIRTWLSVVVAGFLLVLASGSLAPGAADLSPPVSSAPGEAAIPPLTAGHDGPEPIGDPQDLGGESGFGGASGLDGTAPEAIEETESVAEPPDPDDPEVTHEADSGPEAYTVVVNDRVQHFVDRYTGARREIINVWLSRSGHYLDMIREVFRSHGLPEDLAFMAMIESGFNPRAVSPAGAKGLWQFMAATARQYGLRVDQWVDERLDPVKSTNAAAAYLRDLYRLFGSWVLVKAAYNAGEFKVARAIQAEGTTDFWALARSRFLRQETKDFVPAIHAVTLIGRDPARYGFEPGRVEEPVTSSVSVPPSTNLRTLAVRAGLPWAALRVLNPVLIRGVTPPGRPYEVRVPEGTADRVVTALATRFTVTLAGGRTRVIAHDVHVVRPGDTVGAIAKLYGISTADVRRWNKLEQPDLIRPGDRLRVAELHVVERGRPPGRK